MIGLLICFGEPLAAGLSSLAADMLCLPYLKTLKTMINTGRENRKATKNLEMYLLSLAVKLVPHIHMNDHRRGWQKGILKASGLDMELEVYQAYVISKAGLMPLDVTPCLLVFPLLAVIVMVLAVMVYFKEQKQTDELLTRKGGELEDEPPRFVSAIEQELRSSQDMLSIVENYKKNAGEELANGLEILAADMRSSSYEVALTRFETWINSPVLSDVVRGLIGILRGGGDAMYFQMLFYDFKQMELQRPKKGTQKVPPKIRVFSFLMLVCFVITYLAIIAFRVLRSMENMFQKRKRRRRRDVSGAKNQTGVVEKEVKNRSGQKLSGTTQEFLERRPKEPVFMMTPGGYVYLVPEQTGNLLAGGAVSESPYSWRECVQIKVEELLQWKVESMNHAEGTWYVLTRLNRSEVTPARISEGGIVCHI